MFSCEICEILKTLILKDICERMLLYFHYNPHHHYYYHHFHYHRKMHYFRLTMFLTIPLVCNMIPFCFSQILFSSGIYFSLVLFQGFRCSRPVKGFRIRLRPPDKFQMFSLYLYLQLFTLPYIHLLAYNYFNCLFILMFFLYYYMNLIKLLKYR